MCVKIHRENSHKFERDIDRIILKLFNEGTSESV